MVWNGKLTYKYYRISLASNKDNNFSGLSMEKLNIMFNSDEKAIIKYLDE